MVQKYDDQGHPGLGLYNAITSGSGSPVLSPFIAPVRPRVADQVYRVLQRYYTETGDTLYY